MNKNRFSLLTLTWLVLVAQSCPAQTVWDLKTDWSNSANPSGVWTYRGGTTALPSITGWRAVDNWSTTPNDGWAPSNNTGNYLPFWFQSNGTATLTGWSNLDMQAGDIFVHTWDSASGTGSYNPANVIWKSPANTYVNITGGAWLAAELSDRSATWELYRNGALLTKMSGNLQPGDAFSSTSPAYFVDGTNGASALTNLWIATNDVLELRVLSTTPSTGYGQHVGLNFTITAIPEPATYASLAGLGALGLALWRRRRKTS